MSAHPAGRGKIHTKMERVRRDQNIYLGVINVGSQHRHIKLGLAALLLTSWLGTSSWAQAADETQPKGKIEARSSCSPGSRRSVHQLASHQRKQGTHRCAGGRSQHGGAVGRLPLFQGLQQAAWSLLCPDRRTRHPAHRRPENSRRWSAAHGLLELQRPGCGPRYRREG